MAGGAALNVFKMGATGVPKEALNWRLWFAVFVFGLLGAARGVDEGLITGVFNSDNFKESLGLDQLDDDALAGVKGNVSSMVQLGSIPGALLAFFACDYLGRVWATRQLCVIWLIGIAIFMGNNGSMAAVYFGRFFAGIGIGETVVVGPVYLSEISPAPIRGLCTCAFTGAVYLGILIAYFANYGAELHLSGGISRWMVPTSVHLMFGVIILFASIFASESPRHLMRKGKEQEAINVMAKLRGMEPTAPYVIDEIAGIAASLASEQEASAGMGWRGTVREILCIRRNAYRLFLTNFAQLMACWSGGSAITVYAPDLFKIVGITGEEQSLLSTAIFGVVKLVASVICALFLIDTIGRKRSIIAGIALQVIAFFYVAIFLNIVPIDRQENYQTSSSEQSASTGAIAMIYVSGAGWALGWNSGQYLLSSELFPLRIRAVCSSVTMAMHFIGQYTVNKALPSMLLYSEGLTPSGTFYFFGVISVLGAIWVWLCVPEASGRSLESIDQLFELPWYKIGLYGRKFAEDYDREQSTREQLDEKRDRVVIEHMEARGEA
ncbi:putative quinate permease [Hortaea werneckii]|nr:putative quinate permease [Hortaea werneckii]